MKMQPKYEGRSGQLFKSPILEKLARTHFAVPFSLISLFVIFTMYYNFSRNINSVGMSIAIFTLGVFIWTWAEYMLHKYIFHMEPTNKFKTALQYTFHGVHHEFPRDKSRTIMPPAASLIIVGSLFFVFRLIIGDYVYTFLPGFMTGYLIYSLMHYAIHAFKPPRNIIGKIWINHSIHHYKDDNVAFGVSSNLWDRVYGTMPKNTYKRKKGVESL